MSKGHLVSIARSSRHRHRGGVNPLICHSWVIRASVTDADRFSFRLHETNQFARRTPKKPVFDHLPAHFATRHVFARRVARPRRCSRVVTGHQPGRRSDWLSPIPAPDAVPGSLRRSFQERRGEHVATRATSHDDRGNHQVRCPRGTVCFQLFAMDNVYVSPHDVAATRQTTRGNSHRARRPAGGPGKRGNECRTSMCLQVFKRVP